MSLRNLAVALTIVCGCALVLIGQEAKPKAVKYALIIGVDQYEDSKRLQNLKFAEADAKSLAAALKGGFQVTLLLGEDASKAKIEATFQAILKKGTGKDTLLVAFSGHGQQFKPPGGKEVEPFLCTRECHSLDSATQVAFNQLLSDAGDSKMGKALFLIDACRVDPDPNKGSGGLDGNAVKVKAQTVALFAASNGQKAREHPDAAGTGIGHGVFMSEVLSALAGEAKNNRGTVTWDGLVNHIKNEVNLKSKTLFPNLPEDQHQMPHAIGSLVGNAVLMELASVFDETIEEFVWKGEKRKRVVRTVVLGGEKMEFVQVPKGSFTMGSPDSDKEAQDDEKPAHRVTFTKPFWVAKHATTKGQFAAFAKAAKFTSEAEADGKGGYGYDGTKFKQDAEYTWKNTGWTQTDKHPVVNVTWNDAEAFTKWASAAAKKPVRLLSEAEYEYANRAGSSTRYFTGDDIASLEGYANVSDTSAKAKFAYFTAAPFDDGYVFTSPVGVFKPNGFGLYDMTGNVWSWCGDAYDEKLYATRSDGVSDPKPIVDINKSSRVLRGGSWSFDPASCRVAYRSSVAPAYRDYNVGFRVALD